MAEPNLENACLQNLVNHVFLPPKLPQQAHQDDEQRQIDLELIRSVSHSLGNYKDLEPGVLNQYTCISRLLSHLSQTLENPLSTETLQKTMSGMEIGDVLALHIRAQNAAILIRKQSTVTTFEVFEVQALNQEVMSVPGKLVRSFPGPAVEVPNSVTEDSGFFEEIANFLVRMDNDVLKGTTATIMRAGSEVPDTYNSARPHHISHLFLGILCGMGNTVEPRRVVKRIADEVLWDRTYKPWRRSPMWLIVRVALQTTLPSTADYKRFMVYFEAQLLRRALEHRSFSSDLLFAMRVKMARRIYKIRDSAPEFVVEITKAVADETETILQARWAEVQRDQEESPEYDFGAYTFETSIRQTLPSSRRYLEEVFRGHSNNTNSSPFTPTHQVRLSDVRDFSEFVNDALSSSFSTNSHVALFDFEDSVFSNLSAWTADHLGTPSACSAIASCLKQYTSLALSHYTLDVSDKSIMTLTVMKLWVALDELATFQLPLLKDYSPEIEQALVESLVLRTTLHIDQAGMIQRYLRQRHTTARQAAKGSVFSNQATLDSLAVRYFRQSRSHQILKEEIECDAREKREAKIEEMRKRNNEHRDLVDHASQLVHQYSATGRGTSLNHNSMCEKCLLEKRASEMRIEFYEWPLPSSQLDAELVVFELRCPEVVRIWRDATYDLLREVGSLNRNRVNFQCTISDYDALKQWANTPTGTITIASSTRPFARMRYSAKIPTNESSICVNNGLAFKLYHTSTAAWAAGPFEGVNFTKAGTLELSADSSYFHLQYALQSTSHTSNQVLIDQFDCPNDLSLHEHVAFGLLRSGPQLQWMNIARGLEENILTFSRYEVYLLHAQAAWQIGSLADDNYGRGWHTELEDVTYGRLLVKESLGLLHRIQSNWLEVNSVRIIVTLVLRLLTSAQDPTVCQDACAFLQDARDVTFKWLHELLAKLEVAEIGSQIVDYQERVCEMAAVCRSTYDVDLVQLDSLLSKPNDFSIFLTCSIHLYNNQPLNLKESSHNLQTLFCRDRRLTHKSIRTILSSMGSNPQLLDRTVLQLWPAYRPSAIGWASFSVHHPLWVSTSTAGPNSQTVHFNLLEGRLLINGETLGRLSQEYVSHPSYSRLFGQKVLDVVPAIASEMVFATRAQIKDHQILFALNPASKLLLVQAQKDGRTYELIPHTMLAKDFPLFFSSEYHHWADLESQVIEFRPLANPWENNPGNWRLRFSSGVDSIMEIATAAGSSFLADIHSSLFQSISQQLAPLETSRYLHATYSAAKQITIDLPRLKLSFFVNENRALESHNLRGQIVDENQSSGAMLGLQNQLLLRAKDSAAQNLPQPRTVLIPFGAVQFSTQDHHVLVSIDVGINREVMFCQYKVDTNLRYLAANTDLTSRLFKIYLHAITSHCLPDPLTGRTGVEEALYELSEPATFSFGQITRGQAELLKLIGDLTPVRKYHLAGQKSIQNVHWANLSPLSQHYTFSAATESILRYADVLCLFNPLNFDPMSYIAKREQTLLKRAARRSHMYYPPGITMRLSAVLNGDDMKDCPYTGRDCNLTEWAQAKHTAFWASHLAYSRWNQPTFTICDLIDVSESWEEVEGPRDDLMLSYSSSWLDLNLSSSWLSLYNLCRRAATSGNQYQLAVCLASATYSQRLPDNLLRVFLAFATNPAFQGVNPPDHPSYQFISDHRPNRSHVEHLVGNYARDLKDSPAGDVAIQDGESVHEFRQRQRSYYESEISSLRPAFITSLIDQLDYQQTIITFSLWFKVEECVATVRQYFTSCHRNGELRAHFQTLKSILVSQPPTAGLSLPALPSIQADSQSQLPPTVDHFAPLYLQQLMHSRQCPEPEEYFFPSRPSVSTKKGTPTDTARLAPLIVEFQNNNEHPIYTRYGNDLEKSRLNLAAASGIILPNKLPSSRLLNGNSLRYREYLDGIYAGICDSLGPLTPADQIVSVAGIWPCHTPRTVLRMLCLWGRKSLREDWKEAILEYAQAFVEYQRTQHLARLAQENRREEFFKELDLESIGSSGIPRDPDWLLVQLDGDFRARDMQSKVATEMIAPSSDVNTVLQLNMGEGKSSVIVPIVAAALANSNRLVRVVVLKPLWRQTFQLLVNRLAGLAGRRVYYLPFGRHTPINIAGAQRIQEIYRECMHEGGIILVQPEHILSLKLMSIDRLISSSSLEEKNVANVLRGVQDWLEEHSRDVLDESDEILHVRYQLVYTIGQPHPPEYHPDRWTTTQQILSLVARHVSLLKDQFPESFKYEPGLPGQFPFVRMMPDSEDAAEQLVHSIARDVLDGHLPNFSFFRLSSRTRAMALRFLSEKQFPEEDYGALKGSCDSSMWKGLLLLRGLLATGILKFALKNKHYRVDYGLDHSRSLLAVPYHAKDIPSLRAEFGHPDITIVLTCLSYYYHGVTDAQLNTCFELLHKLENPTLEYERWVKANNNMPHHLHHLNNINVKDREQFSNTLFPTFSRNVAVIDFYLSVVVFPKEAKEFPQKLVTSSWDLAQTKDHIKLHVTTGFSGTNDNQYLLPTSIVQADPFKQSSTNALVLTYLLQPENSGYARTQDDHGGTCSTKDFIKLLVQQQPEIRVLLDVGAQMLELSNDGLVRFWLTLRPDVSAAVFFSDKDELVVLPRNGKIVPLVSSPFAQQLDKCIVYLDDGHTRGTDLKLPEHARAAVTLGPKVTKDRLLQGCMRMRKLGHGQSVMFFAPAEVDGQIRKAGRLEPTDLVGTVDVLRWAMLETCHDLIHHIPHWAHQGAQYERRARAERGYIETRDISGLADGWTVPESRSLEEMYGISDYPSQSSEVLTNIVHGMPILNETLNLLGVQSLEYSSSREDEEREASREIERQPQIERLPKSKPAPHSIHPELCAFVNTGSIPHGSSCFAPLSRLPEAFHSQSPNAWSSNLLATADFGRTLANSTSDQLIDYMRPLNWVLYSRKGAIVAVSPYEVDALLPQIRLSTFVRLHVYSPRVTQAMRSFSDLQFYSVPSPSALNLPSPPPLVQMQLNLWAGQLYLKSYDEYCWLCAFLGIFMDTDGYEAEAVEVQSDGFVMPEDRQVLSGYRPEYALCRFPQSPVTMLRELIGRRRKGMEYARTHIGHILYARKLTPDDF
ncbi:hypothetical protein BDV93DRAFT_584535 [Ceratobasidium sp. AG-I]|nr:hypothetical protein BDV93DRAFT_584535 [Ceratobasidium sp. AG-I]